MRRQNRLAASAKKPRWTGLVMDAGQIKKCRSSGNVQVDQKAAGGMGVKKPLGEGLARLGKCFS